MERGVGTGHREDVATFRNSEKSVLWQIYCKSHRREYFENVGLVLTWSHSMCGIERHHKAPGNLAQRKEVVYDKVVWYPI